MAKKISQLEDAGALLGPEIVPILQGGVNKKTTVAAFTSGLSGIPTNWSFTANAGAHPVDLTKRYYTTDDTVYAQGTEFWTNGSGGWFTK